MLPSKPPDLSKPLSPADADVVLAAIYGDSLTGGSRTASPEDFIEQVTTQGLTNARGHDYVATFTLQDKRGHFFFCDLLPSLTVRVSAEHRAGWMKDEVAALEERLRRLRQQWGVPLAHEVEIEASRPRQRVSALAEASR